MEIGAQLVHTDLLHVYRGTVNHFSRVYQLNQCLVLVYIIINIIKAAVTCNTLGLYFERVYLSASIAIAFMARYKYEYYYEYYYQSD